MHMPCGHRACRLLHTLALWCCPGMTKPPSAADTGAQAEQVSWSPAPLPVRRRAHLRTPGLHHADTAGPPWLPSCRPPPPAHVVVMLLLLCGLQNTGTDVDNVEAASDVQCTSQVQAHKWLCCFHVRTMHAHSLDEQKQEQEHVWQACLQAGLAKQRCLPDELCWNCTMERASPQAACAGSKVSLGT